MSLKVLAQQDLYRSFDYIINEVTYLSQYNEQTADEPIYTRFIEKAISHINEKLESFDVLIVIPPGSSRLEIAKRLKKMRGSIHILTYEEYKDKESIIEEAKRNKNRKLLIVPRDTISAVEIAKQLRSGFNTEKMLVFNVANVYLKMIDQAEDYLRLDYERIAKQLEEVGIKVKPGYEGISLTLYNRGDPTVAMCIRSIAYQDMLRSSAIIAEIARSPIRHVIAHLLSLLLPTSLGTLVARILSDAFIALSRKSIDNAIYKYLNSESRTVDLEKSIIDFLKVIRELKSHLRDQVYEGLLDSVAERLGLTLEEFTNLAEGIANILENQHSTILEELRERVKQIEKNSEDYKKWREFIDRAHGIYEDVNKYKYIKIRDNKFYVKVGSKEYELAKTLGYDELANKIQKQLIEKGLVILKGSSGSGKSILAHYVATKLLMEYNSIVYYVTTLQEEHIRSTLNEVIEYSDRYKVPLLIIYDPISLETYVGNDLLAETPPEFEKVLKDVKYLIRTFQEPKEHSLPKAWSIMIVLPTGYYESIKLVFEELSRKEPLYRECFRQYTIDFDIEMKDRLREFVKELLRIYSGCESINVDLLVDNIASYEGSHALVAKYAGLELRKSTCSVEDVQEFLKNSERDPKSFLRSIVESRLGLHTHKFVYLPASKEIADDKVKEKLRKYARILMVRSPFISFPRSRGLLEESVKEGYPTELSFGEYFIQPKLMSYLLREVSEIQDEKEIDSNSTWLSMRNEDLVESILNELLEEAREKFKDEETFKYSPDSLEFWRLFLDRWGYRIVEIINRIAKQNNNCWLRAIHILGTAFSNIAFKSNNDKFNEVLPTKKDYIPRECTSLDELLLVDGEIPIFVRSLFFSWINIIENRVIDPPPMICDLVNLAKDLLNEPGLFSYMFGVALTSLESNECQDIAIKVLYPLLATMKSSMPIPYFNSLLKLIEKRLERGNLRSLMPVIFLDDDTRRVTKYVMSILQNKDLRELLEPWEKATLSVMLAREGVKLPNVQLASHAFKMADELLTEVKREDGILGSVLEVELSHFKARFFLQLREFEKAKNILEEINQALSEARKLNDVIVSEYRRKDLAKHLCLYLPFNCYGSDMLDEVLDSLEGACRIDRALLYFEMGIERRDASLIRRSIEEIAKMLEKSKEEKLYCKYLEFRLTLIRYNFFLAEHPDVKTLYRELEELWKETESVPCINQKSEILARYIVGLALANPELRDKDVKIREVNLESIYPTLWVITRLFLNLFNISERPEEEDIVRSIHDQISFEFQPAFLYIRGLNSRNKMIIKQAIDLYFRLQDLFNGPIDDVLRERLKFGMLAFFAALNPRVSFIFRTRVIKFIVMKLMNTEIHGLREEFISNLQQLDYQGLIELLASSTQLASYILLLDALTRRDSRLAMIHALRASMEGNLGFQLFRELYNTLKHAKSNIHDNDVKLALAKLYFYFSIQS